jgi:hypothetical protein
MKTDSIPVRAIHSAACPSLSGKSQITYELGRDDEARVYVRVEANTGGCFFSREWVPLEAVEKLLDKAPKDRPLSAPTLQPLFRGRSVNTPAFLLAALVQEKWLRVLKGKKRGLEILDPAPFRAKVERFSSPTTKKAPKKKAPAPRKRPSPAKKKTA